MMINPTLALAPAAGCLLLPSTRDKWLCLASAAGCVLQQMLPANSGAYSLPAAAFLTANVARQALIARTPGVQNNFFLKHIMSPWTLIAAYAIQGWSGWNVPQQVIAGTSTATVLYHAGQGISEAASAAVRGDPAAIATCATHIANAIFSAVSVNAAWNGLPFSNLLPEPQPNYILTGAEQSLASLNEKEKALSESLQSCMNFFSSFKYLSAAGVWAANIYTPKYFFIDRKEFDITNDPNSRFSEVRMTPDAHQNLRDHCDQRFKDLDLWRSSPMYYSQYNNAVLWKEAVHRIYAKNLPGTEAAEVSRHGILEAHLELKDLFTEVEMEYLKTVKIDHVVAGENFYPEWIEKNGFEKYVNRIVQWWEKEWYPAWNGMETRWQKANLPRKKEFDAWIRPFCKEEQLLGRYDESRVLCGITEEQQKQCIKKSEYGFYTEKNGPITADTLYRSREDTYQQWLAFRKRIEKEFPLDKIRQFEGKALTSSCGTLLCGWFYDDHSQDLQSLLKHNHVCTLYPDNRTEFFYSTWKAKYQEWLAYDTNRPHSAAEVRKIKEDKQKQEEDFEKAYQQRIADELVYWTTTPLKEIVKGLSAQQIVDRYQAIYDENKPTIDAHFTEEDEKILIDAENELELARMHKEE